MSSPFDPTKLDLDVSQNTSSPSEKELSPSQEQYDEKKNVIEGSSDPL